MYIYIRIHLYVIYLEMFSIGRGTPGDAALVEGLERQRNTPGQVPRPDQDLVQPLGEAHRLPTPYTLYPTPYALHSHAPSG